MLRLLIILLCLLSPTLLAHEGMSMEMPKGPELGASAAFDSHGRLYVVDAANGHVRLRHSDDDGRTLSAPAKSGLKQALAISADHVTAQAEQRADATGNVELRYGELVLTADKLNYRVADDFATAEGQVTINHNGNVFTGPLLQLYVSRFEGEFLTPSFFLKATGGAGKAKVVKFQDSEHLSATEGSYSSCPVVENQEPAWQITAKNLRLDLAANEGQADGAVLRFLGVPILAAPALSFPLSSERKSGWLPPNIFLDNRSGLELGVPYYWNIAPQRDATVAPFVMTKRGVGVDGEFRYLEAGANCQPAVAVYLRPPGGQRFRLLSLAVLRVVDTRIVEIIDFGDPAVLARCGQPSLLA